MAKTAHLLFHKSPAAPHLGSEGFINSLLEQCVRDAGIDVAGHYLVNHDTRAHDRFLPCDHARIARGLERTSPRDIAIFDDFGLQSVLPDRRFARRSMVFFHGLAGGPAIWMNPAAPLDLFCANSRYLSLVLRSVLSKPSFSDAHWRPAPMATEIRYARMPLPARDESAADAALPSQVQDTLARGEYLGHAIQPGKLELEAIAAIMIMLNHLSARDRTPRYRLCLHEHDFETLRSLLTSTQSGGHPAREAFAAALRELRLTLEEIFISVSWLDRPVLDRLMTHSHFGLSYSAVPEAFGLYALESVRAGCPVYTSGAGNMRHALPRDHGINVIETPGMALGDLFQYVSVAERIHLDSTQERAASVSACRRGAAYCSEQYTLASFRADIAACLEQLLGSGAASSQAGPTDACRLTLGPLVRFWNSEQRVLASDHRSRTLTAEEAALLERAIHTPLSDAMRWSPEERAMLDALCAEGVLTVGAVECDLPT